MDMAYLQELAQDVVRLADEVEREADRLEKAYDAPTFLLRCTLAVLRAKGRELQYVADKASA
jgi:hypothetical protein